MAPGNTDTSPDTVLCLNTGSSSVKAALYRCERPTNALVLIASVTIQGIGRHETHLSVRAGSGMVRPEIAVDAPDHAAAVRSMLDELAGAESPAPSAIGHRVVHGGPSLLEHVLIDDSVLARLRAAVPFAPLHLPAALSAIDAVAARFPGSGQVACFDTAFHRTLPTVARRLPLPTWVAELGVRRYGFHGLSCEHIVETVGAETLGRRAVIAHLGSGASLTAIRDGQSVDTSMGLTPAGGIVMGTRSGDIDPGVLVYLVREHGLDADALEALIDRQSGLLGMSLRSPDMHELLAARRHDLNASLAVDSFCASVRKAIGAYATVLDGLDTLVFTAGIGEHEAVIREEIASGLGHLGIQLDAQRNARHAPVISDDSSAVVVRVVPTDENRVVARHVIELVR